MISECSELISECSELISECSELISQCSELISECSELKIECTTMFGKLSHAAPHKQQIQPQKEKSGSRASKRISNCDSLSMPGGKHGIRRHLASQDEVV